MAELKVDRLVDCMGARPVNLAPERSFRSFHFDSRQLPDNGLFFALPGEVADGHDYLAEVAGKTGCAAVVSNVAKLPPGMPALVVDDVMAALHRLASRVRADAQSTRFIAVTGSAGKTSAKEFTAALLAGSGKVLKSPGNWNNWLGMPFSLLALSGDEDFAVLELAMSKPGLGEISTLAEILQPDIGVILNVYPVHLEYLKTVENIARAKCELLAHLGERSCALLNGDNETLLAAAASYKGPRVLFGRLPGNDIVWRSSEKTESGTVLNLDIHGRRESFFTSIVHGVLLENVFAALSIALQAGLSPENLRPVLRDLRSVAGRGVVHVLPGLTLIDETYNSNPEALRKVLRWAASMDCARRIAVIGDMLELGAEEQSFHYQLGREFASMGYNELVTVGSLAMYFRQGALDAGFPENRAAAFIDSLEAGRHVLKKRRHGDLVLFKGSRGMKLELAMRELLNG